jgi:hypothetical protein
MGAAGHPMSGGGLLTVGPPMDGPNSLPPEPEVVGEEPMEKAPDSPVLKLLGQFYAEIDQSDYARQPKEGKWIKSETYLAGKDCTEPPVGYEESTFFYRRLPRLVQIAKAKLFKHICPLQGRPYEFTRSPRRNLNEDAKQDEAQLARLKEEIEDIHEAMELENLMDDIAQKMCELGSAVVYGPIQLSQPRARWQDGIEKIEPNDVLKPMWKFYDPRDVYPDSNAKAREELEFVHFHHVLSKHQIRNLQEDPTFLKDELAELIIKNPQGNWSGNLKRWEYAPFPADMNNTNLQRYVVWMRIGFLDAEAIEALGEKVPQTEEYTDLKRFKELDDKQRRTLLESLWEIWFCDKNVIKVSKRKFQPKVMPTYFIPFRRDPTSIFGIGPCEQALELTEMLVNITRSIDDALNDTAGYQVALDASRIENKDLHIQGRKVWLYRNKMGGPNAGANTNGKPVEFFSVPSNLPSLLEAFKLFESMIPVVTGINEAVVGKDLGSGIRTDSMLNDMWDSLEEFLRDTVGNVDRYFWKPHLRDTQDWIMNYYPNRDEFLVDANIQVQGVRGALRREIVGRKLKELFVQFRQFGWPDWFDEIELGKAIMEGIGVEQERSILTEKQYVERQSLKLQQKQLEVAAGRDVNGEQERAHTSARDTMLNTFKATISKNPENPILIPLAERIFKLTGELDPKAMAALAIWSRQLAQALQEQGVATEQEKQILSAPVKATNPLELAPDARNPQQAQQASISGPGPQTPPNPVQPMATTQQVLGGAQ